MPAVTAEAAAKAASSWGLGEGEGAGRTFASRVLPFWESTCARLRLRALCLSSWSLQLRRLPSKAMRS